MRAIFAAPDESTKSCTGGHPGRRPIRCIGRRFVSPTFSCGSTSPEADHI